MNRIQRHRQKSGRGIRVVTMVMEVVGGGGGGERNFEYFKTKATV